jgi:hypothetical protein
MAGLTSDPRKQSDRRLYNSASSVDLRPRQRREMSMVINLLLTASFPGAVAAFEIIRFLPPAAPRRKELDRFSFVLTPR